MSDKRSKARKFAKSKKDESIANEMKTKAREFASEWSSEDSPKGFAKKFKKSYDFRDHGVMIDAKDQQAAEESVNPKILKYLEIAHSDLQKGETKSLNLGSGILKLTKKDQGLFNGWWEDSTGQVTEKFDDQTIAMVAKNLIVKGRVSEEVFTSAAGTSDSVSTPSETGTIRIKYGDFELELKKSLRDFAKAFNKPLKGDIKKAVSIWRRKRADGFSEKQAVKDLIEGWDRYGEDFSQMLFAVQKLKGE